MIRLVSLPCVVLATLYMARLRRNGPLKLDIEFEVLVHHLLIVLLH